MAGNYTSPYDEFEKDVDTETAKCKSCGSNMSFDPETQQLKCAYCGYVENFEKTHGSNEIPLEKVLAENKTWNEEALVFNCENCGARVVANKGETAGKCPFCGTSHVVASSDLQGIKPNAVIPFKVGKTELLKIFKRWVKKRFFAPSAFKKSADVEKTQGVYMPYFTFDSTTNSVYEGKIGKTRTRTIRTKNGTKTESYIEWRHISGTISSMFDDVFVNAGLGEDAVKTATLEPFDKTTTYSYDNQFLAGYVAKRYEKDIQTCWDEAKDIMDNEIRQQILSRYDHDAVSYVNVRTNHFDVTFKYVLLPVYVINYKFKKKKYTTYVNGSTGKIIGKSPVSFWKVLFTILGIIALVAGVVAIIYFSMNS